MIVVDANLLLYAYSSASTKHKEARAWLERILSGSEPIGLSWQALSAFIRISTNPHLPGFRRLPEEATRAVDEWLEWPNVRILVPGDGYWAIFRRMVLEGKAVGGLVSDAQIAALTIEYGGVLYTTDRDFARFPGLRWENPLG
jgi:toxin-antitoxin system PIN domain toxin